MKVKQLISQLKKMPQDLDVYWADHDQGTYEVNNLAKNVRVIDQSEADDYDRRQETFSSQPETYVVIRP